jgi:hypothetical protein
MAPDVGTAPTPDPTAPVNGWWKDFVEVIPGGYQELIAAEEDAVSVVHFHPTFVPGLLQTEAYAAAITQETTLKAIAAEDVAKLVHIRMQRQQSAFDPSRRKQLAFLMDEACLYRPVGLPDVMREQLRHLVAVSTRPNVTLVVLPFRAKPHPGLLGPFMILGCADDLGTLLCFEWQGGNTLERNPDIVGPYRDLAEILGRPEPGGSSTAHLIETALDRLHGTV